MAQPTRGSALLAGECLISGIGAVTLDAHDLMQISEGPI
jgi:hypothetical protein